MSSYHVWQFFIVHQVFKNLDFLGWYTTGSGATENDIKVHKQVTDKSFFLWICCVEEPLKIFQETWYSLSFQKLDWLKILVFNTSMLTFHSVNLKTKLYCKCVLKLNISDTCTNVVNNKDGKFVFSSVINNEDEVFNMTQTFFVPCLCHVEHFILIIYYRAENLPSLFFTTNLMNTTLLILAVCRCVSLINLVKWPGSQRVSRSSVG